MGGVGQGGVCGEVGGRENICLAKDDANSQQNALSQTSHRVAKFVRNVKWNMKVKVKSLRSTGAPGHGEVENHWPHASALAKYTASISHEDFSLRTDRMVQMC